MADPDEQVEPRIVSAVANMTSTGGIGHRTKLADDLEDAAGAAVMACLKAGLKIEDTEAILAVKHLARAMVLHEHRGTPIPPVDTLSGRADVVALLTTLKAAYETRAEAMKAFVEKARAED